MICLGLDIFPLSVLEFYFQCLNIYILNSVAFVVVVQLLSHVWFFSTPWTVVYQAPLSLEFSRQDYWSELLFLSPEDLPNSSIKRGSPALKVISLPSKPPGKPTISQKVKMKVSRSCPTLCDPMDCSRPGSSVPGDFPGKNTGVGSCSLLQGIFPGIKLRSPVNPLRWILYQMSYQGSPPFPRVCSNSCPLSW